MRAGFRFVQAEWLKSFGPTVWHEFSPMALKYNAINLGQGFPNFEPPPFLLDATVKAVQGTTEGIAVPGPALINQYARPNGHLRLVQALARLYSPLVGEGREGAEGRGGLDPLTQIQVTAGASEGIFCAINALCSPGDEVIVISPFFDIYEGAIARAGAKLVQVPLNLHPDATAADDFTLDFEALRRAVNERTRVLILNTPHNPTGKVFSKSELQKIADIVLSTERMMVVADEVYEFITYGPDPLPRIATLPGMFPRTVCVSSAAKTFSVTGWKIGWVYGPLPLVDAISRAHQFTTYSIATPLQEAVAVALEAAQRNGYFEQLRQDYLRRRGALMKTLTAVGLKPKLPSGSFFIVCDIGDRQLPPSLGRDSSLTKQFLDQPDWNFCRWLTTEVGVTAIPCSAFYTGNERPASIVRFAFCKKDSDLDEAERRLAKLGEKHAAALLAAPPRQ